MSPFPLPQIRSRAVALLLPAIVVSCADRPVEPGVWPGFRGPGGSGISSASGLPVEWGPDSENVRWRTELPGQGNSSPIVSHDRIFLTAAVPQPQKQMQRRVLALDLESGAVLWQTTVADGPEERKHPLNTSAAPTPVTDGRAVFAHFGDVLVALDRDGETLWSTVVDPQYLEFSHYGAGSSPVLTDRAVIVAQDREGNTEKLGWIGAFDKATGEELWRRTWDGTCCSYATPLVVDRGGGTEVVFPQAGRITAFHAATGETLWVHPLAVNQPVASAVVADDLLALFSGGNQVRIGQVIRLHDSGAETRPEPLWQVTRLIPQTSSPVASRGRIYTVVDAGVLVARELVSGQQLWVKRLPSTGYEPSLVAADGRIYATNLRGETAVVNDSPVFELVAFNSLGERGSNASPAVAGSSLLIRTQSGLFRIDGPGPADG